MECPSCSKDISPRAGSCPNCGEPNPADRAQLLRSEAENTKGKIGIATITRVTDFGAYALLDGCQFESLIHCYEIPDSKGIDVDSILTVGQKVRVRMLGPDARGKNRMSMKEV